MRPRFYIVGDIHGSYEKLIAIHSKITAKMKHGDFLIFLGDYIDRGPASFNVIEFLISISDNRTFFLTGNHERMLIDYIAGKVDYSLYSYNGGDSTLKSYREMTGSVSLPPSHEKFFNGLVRYYEGRDFIAVHAGLRPGFISLDNQTDHDLVWIREPFFRSEHRFQKTVIFGHTPTYHLHGRKGEVYIDDRRNIIGIDTGAVYGGKLTCIIWPDRDFIQV